MSIESRLKKIEADLGAGQPKRYFIYKSHWGSPYEDKDGGRRFGELEKLYGCGSIFILEKQGEKFTRDIDPLSEEGKAILQRPPTEKG